MNRKRTRYGCVCLSFCRRGWLARLSETLLPNQTESSAYTNVPLSNILSFLHCPSLQQCPPRAVTEPSQVEPDFCSCRPTISSTSANFLFLSVSCLCDIRRLGPIARSTHGEHGQVLSMLPSCRREATCWYLDGQTDAQRIFRCRLLRCQIRMSSLENVVTWTPRNCVATPLAARRPTIDGMKTRRQDPHNTSVR